MKLIFVSGISGSGKSLCLNALEDLGIYCIDNLPAQLLPALVEQNNISLQQPMGVGIDARNINSLKHIHEKLIWLKDNNINYSIIFLDATDDEIIKRYKESRRKHPMINTNHSLIEAIKLERSLLQDVKANANIVIDTTNQTPHQLRRKIRDFVIGQKDHDFVLRLESFGYKHGIPRDADFVFDVRCLPNPHWNREISHLSGKDQPIKDFLAHEPSVDLMIHSIHEFISKWVDSFQAENRSHITLAIGCTGGRHRSVYVTENIANIFSTSLATQIHHRDINLQL